MEDVKKPIFGHIAMVSKGWYRHSKYLWQEYMRAICCEGHYYPENMTDVAHILLKYVTTYPGTFLTGYANDILSIHEEIRNTLRRIVVFYKDVPEFAAIIDDPVKLYDAATILYCHSRISCSEISNYEGSLRPSDKVLPFNLNGQTRSQYIADVNEKFGKDTKPYETKDGTFWKTHFESYTKSETVKDWINEGKLTFED